MRVLLFSTARDAAGTREIRLPVPARGAPLGELLDALRRRRPALGAILSACRFARDGEYLSGRRARVSAGDEIAVHPPYSGG